MSVGTRSDEPGYEDWDATMTSVGHRPGFSSMIAAAVLGVVTYIVSWGPVYVAGNDVGLLLFPLWFVVIIVVEVLGFVSLVRWSRATVTPIGAAAAPRPLWQLFATLAVMLVTPLALWYGDAPLVIFGLR